ncbi:uncharacterized protein [Periplaneta americana]|uniref:uncharacterized protein n=1 Tax=Periplaneta americana TaxID=6978 RepID=UPI0037E8181C
MFHILSKMEKRVLPDMLKAREQKQCLNYQRKNAKKIRELKKDIKNVRNVFSETQSRNKQQLLNLLQHHPKIQLACKEMEPLQVIDHMKQLAFTQRKELDHLKHMKKQELKKLKQLQLQAAELNDFDKLPGLNLHKPRYTEQTLTNKIENVGMRYNAAAKINKIYRNITEILKQRTPI